MSGRARGRLRRGSGLKRGRRGRGLPLRLLLPLLLRLFRPLLLLSLPAFGLRARALLRVESLRVLPLVLLLLLRRALHLRELRGLAQKVRLVRPRARAVRVERDGLLDEAQPLVRALPRLPEVRLVGGHLVADAARLRVPLPVLPALRDVVGAMQLL